MYPSDKVGAAAAMFHYELHLETVGAQRQIAYQALSKLGCFCKRASTHIYAHGTYTLVQNDPAVFLPCALGRSLSYQRQLM